jgi:hypothetical protein
VIPSPIRVLVLCSVTCVPLAITGVHAAGVLFGSALLIAATGAFVIAAGAVLPAVFLWKASRRVPGHRAP